MRFWLFNSLFVGSCGYALWRGNRDERLCALIFIGGLLGTTLVRGWTANYQTVVWGVMAVDTLMLVALGLLALTTDRFWPLWLTSMQLVEVAAHGVVLLSSAIIPLAYRSLISIWAYPMLLILWLATYRTHLRKTRTGAARYWPNSWLRPLLRMPTRTPDA